MIAAAITGGSIVIDNLRPAHMTSVMEKLRDVGVVIRQREEATGDGSTYEVGATGPFQAAGLHRPALSRDPDRCSGATDGPADIVRRD